MQEYKYTYQDWQEENISPIELDTLRKNGELSFEDYHKVRSEQESAIIGIISSGVIVHINLFLEVYNRTLVKENLLESFIITLQDEINRFKIESLELYREVLWGFDGRDELTYQDIAYTDYALDKPSTKIHELNFYFEQRIALKFNVNNYEKYRYIYLHNGLAPSTGRIMIAVALKFLKWLFWFQKRERTTNDVGDEQFYKIAINQTDREVSKRKAKYITWPELFKDSKQADRIVSLLVEHLSSTGQWLTEPKGRYLVALSLELKEKGYFKNNNIITNPLIAIAFNIQFNTTLSPKNFQPQQSKEAEDYREYFKIIPPYRTDSTSH